MIRAPLSPLAFPYGDEQEKRLVERLGRKRERDERRVNWAIGIITHPLSQYHS